MGMEINFLPVLRKELNAAGVDIKLNDDGAKLTLGMVENYYLQLLHFSCANLKTEKRFAIEKAKFRLMNLVRDSLQSNGQPYQRGKVSTGSNQLKLLFLSYVLLAVPDGFNDIGNLLETFPAAEVSTDLFLSLGTLFSICELSFYLIIEMRMISHELHIPFYKLAGLLQGFHDQLDIFEKIQALFLQRLNDVNQLQIESLKSEDICNYQNLLVLFEQDFSQKQTYLKKSQKKHHSTGWRVLKLLSGAIVTAIYAIDRYFTAHTLFLIMFSAAQPWVAVAVAVTYALIKLVPYILLKLRGLSRAVNHFSGAPNELLKKMQKTKNNSLQQNANIQSAVKVYEQNQEAKNICQRNATKIAASERRIQTHMKHLPTLMISFQYTQLETMNKRIDYLKTQLQSFKDHQLSEKLLLQKELLNQQSELMELLKEIIGERNKSNNTKHRLLTRNSTAIASTPKLIPQELKHQPTPSIKSKESRTSKRTLFFAEEKIMSRSRSKSLSDLPKAALAHTMSGVLA